MNTNYDEVKDDVVEDIVEVEDEQAEEEVEDEEQGEDTTDWKKVAEEEKVRREKAEKAIIKSKTAKETKTSSGINLADSVAILNAKVHEDDIERVERYAKSEGVSIREALKDPELKAILALREENRNTAVATNTSNTRRGSTQVAADVLIANAQNGKLPDSDADIERLIAAKRKQT